jgi:hypothetical protein
MIIRSTGTAGGFTATYESYSAASDTDDDQSITLTAPSGITDGDMLIIFIAEESEGTAVCSGFTQLANPGGSSHASWMFYKEASSESGNYTCNGFGGNSTSAFIARVSKSGGSWVTPSTANYYDASYADSSTGVSSTVNTQDNSVLIGGFSNDGSVTISTDPTGMTRLNSRQDGTMTAAFHYQTYVTGSSSVSKNIVWSVATRNTSILVVLEAQ